MKVVLTEEEWNHLKREPSAKLITARDALLDLLWKETPAEVHYMRYPGDPGVTIARCDSLNQAAKEVLKSGGRPFHTREDAITTFNKALLSYGDVRKMILKLFDDLIFRGREIECVPKETETKKQP